MMLVCNQLTGGYKRGTNIINDISFTLHANQSLAIFGKNGAGKSTLAKAIVGLLPFRSGSILLNGIEINKKPTFQIVSRDVGYFWQGGSVFSNLSIMENMIVASSGMRNSDVKIFLNELIRLSDKFSFILTNQNVKATNLSGGNRHLLALAMILLQHPKLLILDEPSAGLAPVAVRELYLVLTEIQRQKDISILLIEQNIEMAMGFCSDCIVLNNGMIAKELSLSDLHTFEEIEKVLFE
jgi:ABC-type branched-subunit amino acid transport system ATPase component